MRFNDVYDIVRKIPEGKVASYGQIAMMCGEPRNARVVGYAMASCPSTENVPCHRVVDQMGRTKRAFDTYAPGTQRALLESEGVGFRADGTVDMEHYQWDGDMHEEK